MSSTSADAPERLAGAAAPATPTLISDLTERARRHRDAGRHREWAAAAAEAVALAPEDAGLYLDLGHAHSHLKDYKAARSAFEQAVRLSPDSPDAHNNLGIALQELGQLAEATASVRRAADLQPGNPSFHNNLGVALAEDRKFEEAIAAYNRALAIAPDYTIAWNNLGNALRSLGRNEEAVAAIQRAIAQKPDYAEAYNNIAIAYVQLEDHQKAIANYDRSILLRPDYPEAHMNRALEYLLVGKFAEGWADYEWRWRGRLLRPREFPAKRWDGGPLAGKRVLVYFEQGLGDTLQFIRYAAELKARGATVIFEGQPPLAKLLARTPGVDEFVLRGAPVPPVDFYAPLLSLPGLFQTDLDSIPAPVPYVFTDPALAAAWKARLAPYAGLRVGIAWQGNPEHRGDKKRSMPLACFEPLARVPGVKLISLQHGHGTEQMKALADRFPIVDLTGIEEDTDGFLRTAAVIKNLDLVVSADTAVAHLAGAMGVPVWVAISTACDWRWLQDRADSPWYPTLRLFRQKAPGDWPGVFQRIVDALRDFAAKPFRASPADGHTFNPAEVYEEAKGLLARGALAEAVDRLRRVVRVDSGNAAAHHDLGVAYGRTGQLQPAIKHFRVALKLDPDHAVAFGNLATALLDAGDAGGAAEHLEGCLARGHRTHDLLFKYGRALAAAGRHREAAEHLRHAWEADPTSADTLLALGRAQRSSGALEAAADSFRRALDLRPDWPEATSELALVFSALGRGHEADALHEAAVRARPGSADAQNNWGTVLARRGDLAGAAEAFQRAVYLRPDSATCHLNLAHVLLQAGRFE